MPVFIYANNVSTTLAGAITSPTQTTITLASAANLPTITAGQTFTITIADAATRSNFEIMYMTAHTGASCTVVRGQEGTSASTWSVSDLAFGCVTAAELSQFAPLVNSGNAIDTSSVAQTKAGAFTATAGLVSGAGIAVGGALTGATTGAFSGLLTTADGINNAGETLTTGAIAMPAVGVNGFMMTPVSDTQNGTFVITNAANSTNLFEFNQLSSSKAQMLLVGNMVSSFSGAFSDPSALLGDMIAQRSTSAGAMWLGGASRAGVVNWNATVSGQLALVENGVGFALVTGNTYTTTSDRKFKKNIAPVGDAIETIMRLKPSSWNDIATDHPNMGFVAQDVQEVVPQLTRTIGEVKEGDGESLGVVYHGFHALSIAGLQEVVAKLKAANVPGF